MELDTETILSLAAGAIAVANVITACFPSVGEHPAYNALMKVLNIVSINFGRNKNADDV